jgi:hypothetical protein
MVAGSGTGDIQQVALGVVDLFEIGLVGNALDPLRQRDHLVVAGHSENCTECQTFGQMHCAE